jgi:hypothetical protein
MSDSSEQDADEEFVDFVEEAVVVAENVPDEEAVGEAVPEAVTRPVDLVEEAVEEILKDDLKALLEMVAFKTGMVGVDADVWVRTNKKKMRKIGVTKVRDFVGSVLTINKRLGRAHQSKLSNTTLTLILKEACAMWGKADKEEGGE